MTPFATHTQASSEAIRHKRWRARTVLLLGMLVFFAYGYDLYALQTVAPSLLNHPTWDVTPGTLGTLASVTALGEAIGAFAGGQMSDVYGRRTPIAICVAWISGCMLAAGLVTSLPAFGATRFLLGIGLGALAPLVCAVVVDWARVGRRSLYCGTALSAIPLGGVAAASAGRGFLPGTDFQWMFLVGVLPILLVPACWHLIPAAAPEEASLPDRATRRDTHVVSNEWWALFEPGWLVASILFSIASFIGLLLIYGTSSWLPSLMTDAGYDLDSTLELVLVFNCGAVAGTLLFSMLADWIPAKICVVCLFLSAVVALRALTTAEGHTALLAAVALAGAGILGAQNVINSYVARYYPHQIRGTALGFTLGVGRFGSLLGPSYLTFLIGVNSDAKVGFYALVAPALIGAVVVFLVPRGRRSERLRAS
ncbi:MFS transporter [Streptomyces sp. HUAS ZL42]|uniref:MFS transporter n=1 Tax=Streptomyces sp. HUAS ZL42 TaxID=3231715 RepID=UPI00345E4C12